MAAKHTPNLKQKNLFFAFSTSCLLSVAACAPTREVLLEQTSDLVADRLSAGQSMIDARAEEKLQILLHEKITADEAVQIALLKNPQLRTTYEMLGFAHADLLQAGLLDNPRAEFEILWHDDIPAPALLGWQFAVDFNLIKALSTPSQVFAASKKSQAAQERLASLVLDTSYYVRVAYLRAITASKRASLQGAERDAAMAAQELVKRMHESGGTNNVEWNAVSADAATSQLMKVDTDLAAAQAKTSLDQWLGIEPLQATYQIPSQIREIPNDAELAGVFPTSEETVLSQQAIDRSLVLSSLRAEIDAASTILGIQNWTRFLPSMHIGAITEDEHGVQSWGPSVGATLPLFDQGQGQNARLATELRLQIAQHEATALEIRIMMRTALQNLTAAKTRAAYIRNTLLPIRMQSLDEAIKQYNGMYINPQQLLFVKRQQLADEMRYAEALEAYWSSYAAIRHLQSGGSPAVIRGETPNLSMPASTNIKNNGDAH